MSWFDSSFGFAKTALSQAQKSIDQVLDIQEDGKSKKNEEQAKASTSKSSSFTDDNSEKKTDETVQSSKSMSDSFISTWGNAGSFWSSGDSKPDKPKTEPPKTVVKKSNEPTPKRKLTSAHSSNTPSTLSNMTTPSTTPTTTTSNTKNIPTMPLFNPVSTNKNANLTSTPKQPVIESVDGGTSTIVTSNTAEDNPSGDDSLSILSTMTGAVAEEKEEDGRLPENKVDENITANPNDDASLQQQTNTKQNTEAVEQQKEERTDKRDLLKGKESGKQREARVVENDVIHGEVKMDCRTSEMSKIAEEGRKYLENAAMQIKVENESLEQPAIEERDVLPATTSPVPFTTVPIATVPVTTVPIATVPVTTVPIASVPVTTVPEAIVTVTTEEAVPVTTEATVPVAIKETVPITTEETVPVTTVPVTTVPVGTVSGVETTPVSELIEVKEEHFCERINQEDMAAKEKELASVKELLQVREAKVLEQSEELIKLQQTNQEMQRCLDEFKKQIEKMDDSKDTLMRRVSTAEEKIQTLTRERNGLKKQLQTLSNDQRDTAEKRLTEILKEKDEMIAGLMEEGEKLSKQELQSNNVIKKLRSKEKTNENTITTQKQQLEDMEGDIKSLKEVIKKKEENEQKYQESLAQLNTMFEQQTKELNQLKPEKNELQERARSLQTNLDNAYRELTELRKSNALSQSAMEEATVSAQQVAKEELKKELEEQRMKGEKEKDALLLQISELRMSVSRAEHQATWREDQLRQEISDLHKRIQESEGRNQDLSDTISDATRPLLRQIEHLRSAQTAQSNNWERLESSLTQRLVEAQSQLNAASEKERNAVEKLLTVQSRVSGLEEQLNSVRQERSQLAASLETERTKLKTLEETHQREISRHDTYRLNVQQNVEELKKEKESLERQLEYERVRLEAESRKADLELQEKEKLRNQLAMSLTSIPLASVSRQSSTSTPNESLHNLDTLSSGSTSDLNSILRLPGASLGSASVMEHLQSLLKQREGELANSQEMVASLERSRSAITEELAKVSASNEALKKEVETIPLIQEKLVEITKKYEALLQMFGEKVEEAEELRLDIQDLKSLYRQQIEELVVKK